ncbi:winged helix-turn-helix domain-containing protein [Coralloluteibacterium thermophilus]|uniref:Transcriptional regulator n=1 Tax=Coralloluteibacterium thermophilum TaxID=2707049 RepID=A0ABV9NM32_9GAMM
MCSAEELLSDCWPGQCLGDNAVHKHVALLRAALGDSARRPRYISTVHRRGYRLLVPVVPADDAWADDDAWAACIDALVAGLCGLDDLLRTASPPAATGGRSSALARLVRENRRLRRLCHALLERCRRSAARSGPR